MGFDFSMLCSSVFDPSISNEGDKAELRYNDDEQHFGEFQE
jgi:hypothetical protein